VRRWTIAAAVAGLLLGACSAGDLGEVATLEDALPEDRELVIADDAAVADADDAALAFAQCIRDHGITDFEDPTLGEKGQVEFADGAKTNDNPDATKQAHTACSELLEGSIASKDQGHNGTIEQQDQLLDFAACMRENGFDMPDPDASGDAFGGVDKDDPDFAVALVECDGILAGDK
jgi:hypothetical protein